MKSTLIPALLMTAPLLAASPTLKEAAAGRFLIGGALHAGIGHGRDTVAAALAARHFSTITPENALKWQPLTPEPGRYDFKDADAFVAFGEQHGLFMVGHTLLWHQQVPDWIVRNPDGSDPTREELLERLRSHIRTVVGRYKGRIQAWDVVNEAVNGKGELVDHPWYRVLGEEAIFEAFRIAHETDPAAELYYNDYGHWEAPRRARILELVKALRARGLRVDGVGLQEHLSVEGPSIAAMEEVFRDYAAHGVPVMVTELDVSVLPSPWKDYGADIAKLAERRAELDPYTAGLPADMQARLAHRYRDLFELYLRQGANLKRVTFWGVTDRSTWLHNWPIRGRTDYPLLFDHAGQPKPAFDAVISTLTQAPR